MEKIDAHVHVCAAFSEEYPRRVGGIAPAKKGVESNEVVGQVTRDVAFEKPSQYGNASST